MNFGLPELTIILIIVLLLFGSTRLPKLSRSIGQSVKELRESLTSKSTPTETPSEQTKDQEKETPGEETKINEQEEQKEEQKV